MAEARFTIDCRLVGVYRHRYAACVVAVAFSHEPNVIRLAFGE